MGNAFWGASANTCVHYPVQPNLHVLHLRLDCLMPLHRKAAPFLLAQLFQGHWKQCLLLSAAELPLRQWQRPEQQQAVFLCLIGWLLQYWWRRQSCPCEGFLVCETSWEMIPARLTGTADWQRSLVGSNVGSLTAVGLALDTEAGMETVRPEMTCAVRSP